MKAIDWILIGIIALAIGGVIAYLIKRKKEGKSGCGCGCQGCPSAEKCHAAPKTEEENGKTV